MYSTTTASSSPRSTARFGAAASGLLHDSVRQVGDARGVDDPHEVELDAPGLEAVQRASAATKHDRHQVDDELVEQSSPEALLNGRCPHEVHVLARCSRPRLLDGVFDALGDERVRRIAR